MTETVRSTHREPRGALGSFSALVFALALATFSVLGTFEGRPSASASTARVLPALHLSAPRMDVSDLVAGDSAVRAMTLRNTTPSNFSQTFLEVRTWQARSLATGPNALQVRIERCSVAWRGTRCAGTRATVLPASPVTTMKRRVWGLRSARGRGIDFLLVTLSLPRAAPNVLQGLPGRITYSFIGVV